jgi:hypothetical protein
MTAAPTAQEIRRGLEENARAPYGTVRNARAEALSAAAESAKDPALLRRALNDQIDAYEWSSESSRMVVPFARLLQEYDRDPSAFGGHEVHTLYWHFKWVAGRIVESPDIPLEAVERWLVDMERRYRIAGYSERAVRQAEFHLAEATGDPDRMERSMNAWAAAGRDVMSDCHACELNTQGWFWAHTGRDEKALETWREVLDGGRTCREEPHRVLAESLLPLTRLGRFAEARTNHLRGYRMARGNESLLKSVASHIEFCALTGNESRGLEILAEHAPLLGPLVDVETRLQVNGGVLVLLRRLRELGLGDRPAVPYEGAVHTVSELFRRLDGDASAIAARFDARNGTTRVSERLAERIGRQPFTDALPLGVRSPVLPGAVAPAGGPGVRGTGGPSASTTAPAADGRSGPDPAELVSLARAARRSGHPSATELWRRVAEAAAADGVGVVDAVLAADLLEHRALAAGRAGEEGAVGLLGEAAEAHRAAGQDARAAFCRLAEAGTALQFGAAPERVRALMAVAAEAAEALDATEPARARRIAAARLTGVRIEAHLRGAEAERAGVAAPEPDARLVAELEAFIAGSAPAAGDKDPSAPADGGFHGTADVVAEAEQTLAKVLLAVGGTDRAEELLSAAAGHFLLAGRPWEAAEPEALRAGVLAAAGDLEAAETAARAALAHGTELTEGDEQGGIRLRLTEILLHRGAPAEAAEHALDAAHWFDQAGLAAGGGARARLLLARAYGGSGRTAEAAEVLGSALPDLVKEHDEGEAVGARQFLGELLRDLHDPRGAAEQFLLAAETAREWDNPRPQASLAHSAAEALAQAGLRDQSRAAYSRALELWRGAGDNPVAEVRVLRSLAWLAVAEDMSRESFDAARALMGEAFGVLEGATEPTLRYEWGQTCRQLAEQTDDFLAEDPWADEHAEEGEDGRDAVAGGDAEAGGDGSEITGPGTDGGEGAGAVAGTGPMTERALRERIVELLDEAGEAFRELGTAALEERCQALVRATWADQELDRPEAGRRRLDALAGELRELEGEEPAALLRRVEQIREEI